MANVNLYLVPKLFPLLYVFRLPHQRKISSLVPGFSIRNILHNIYHFVIRENRPLESDVC